MKIIDAHTHFFSYTWFEHFYNLAQNQLSPGAGVEAVAEKLGWQMPPRAPNLLGKIWVQEQDSHGVDAQVLFASKLNDAEQLSAAVHAYPDRLIGYVMIDPTQDNAREQTHYSLNILGMKGVILFPAMHHFHAYDERALLIYEEAFAADVPVFINFGYLKVPIYQKLGIDDGIDLQFTNPIDLKAVARDFSEVNFIIPHFGCGYFDEALEVAGESENVYFDTASSNSWIKAPLTLTAVFRKCLEVMGPERLLFGTDSSCFPRGWRKDLFETQQEVLDELKLRSHEKDLIWGGNIARILNLA